LLNRVILDEEDGEESEKGEEAEEGEDDEESARNEEAKEENVHMDVDNGASDMTADERIQECISRNRARREAEGDSATSKWCNRCFENKIFDDFSRDHTCIFGLCPSCKV
jgi:hypothetical protein